MNQRTCGAETCLLSIVSLLIPWERENRKDIEMGRTCIINEKNSEWERSLLRSFIAGKNMQEAKESVCR